MPYRNKGARRRASWAALQDDGGAGQPEGALAYADFKNGTYHYAGNALSDFIVQNTDWGSFDPDTEVVPGTGLIGAPCLAPGLFAAYWSTGIRIVAQINDLGAEAPFQIEAFDAPDYNQELWAKVVCVSISGADFPANTSFRVNALDTITSSPSNVTGNTTHELDVSFHANGSITAIIDGGSPLTSVGTGSANLINTVGIGATPDIVCERIDVYAL
jgi:hypothetical protein